MLADVLNILGSMAVARENERDENSEGYKGTYCCLASAAHRATTSLPTVRVLANQKNRKHSIET